MTHPTKESLDSNTLSGSPQSCPTGRTTSIATQPGIPILRRDRDTEKDLSKVSAPEFEIRGKIPALSLN
jgi:hypothetical protein